MKIGSPVWFTRGQRSPLEGRIKSVREGNKPYLLSTRRGEVWATATEVSERVVPEPKPLPELREPSGFSTTHLDQAAKLRLIKQALSVLVLAGL